MLRYPRRLKHNNQPTHAEGRRFASKKEARRYLELKLLERTGAIKELKLQVRFPLPVNGILITTYIADFTYTENGQMVVEDSKGYYRKGGEYPIKRRLMRAVYGVTILES